MLTLSFNPIWSFVDLDGNQLDDTYYLFTLFNTLPYLPSHLWQDEDGNVAWSDPIQFNANGTLPYNMYWDTSIVYRLEIRQGPTQDDPLIYLVENYIPESSGSSGDTSSATDNQITNPQFANVNFTGPSFPTMTTTLNVVDIAPGWQVITTGSGTLVISQLQLEGVDDIDTNPSYAISIANSGFSTVTLRQRFNNNGALWAGQAVSLSLTASASSATNFSAELVYSGGSDPDTTIIADMFSTGYTTFVNSVSIPTSTNTDAPSAAYTDLDIIWSGSVTVNITSIQLIGVEAEVDIAYQQTTIERQIDHEFHYYKPQLAYKPIPSYAIGWDFAFNPCQELGVTVTPIATGANGSTYIADQTIVFQTVDSAIGATFGNYGVTLTTASDSSFALIQYLDAKTAVELLNQVNSVQMKAYLSAGSGTLGGTVNLYWTTGSIPTISSPDFDSLVTSITAGVPTSSWTLVPRGTLGSASFTLTTSKQVFDFNSWDASAVSNINNATAFAIVVTFDTMVTTQNVTVQYISLCGGQIATRPAPLTVQQTREALGYYYETSYAAGPASGASTATSETRVMVGQNPGGAGGTSSYAQTFNQSFVYKRAVPDVTFISEAAGTTNAITMTTYSGGVAAANADASAPTDGTGTIWTSYISQTGIYMSSIIGTAFAHVGSNNVPYYSVGSYNFIADARFGVV